MPKVIPHNWAVPDRFRARLGTHAGKQRAMVHEGHLLLILHALPVPGDITRKAVLFWRSPDGVWKAAGAAKGGIAGLRGHVESFMHAIAELEDRGEKATHAADYFAVLHAVAPMLRASRNLHKTLQAAREAIPDDVDLISLRDHAYEVERTAEIVHGDAKSGLDFMIAERAEEQAQIGTRIAVSSHRLNLVAALFFPITALGGIFGMNFVHGFEASFAPWLFWIVVIVAFVFGFTLRASLDRPGVSASKIARGRAA